MIRHGEAPYLECSSQGDQRFSAFYARIKGRRGQSIEDIYQAAKVFEDGSTNKHWRDAKGLKPVNVEEITQLYQQLWIEYLSENLSLVEVILSATGLSDKFGQAGHNCQATVLWNIRQLTINKRAKND